MTRPFARIDGKPLQSCLRFGPCVDGGIEPQVRILHFEAETPPAEARPEVLISAGGVALVISLRNVKPADLRTAARLYRMEAAPLLRARQLALAALALGQRWHDQRRVYASVLGPVGVERKGGHEAYRRIRRLEKGSFA